jgi:hypothetical protein
MTAWSWLITNLGFLCWPELLMETLSFPNTGWNPCVACLLHVTHFHYKMPLNKINFTAFICFINVFVLIRNIYICRKSETFYSYLITNTSTSAPRSVLYTAGIKLQKLALSHLFEFCQRNSYINWKNILFFTLHVSIIYGHILVNYFTFTLYIFCYFPPKPVLK